jgi:hypothetical protein
MRTLLITFNRWSKGKTYRHNPVAIPRDNVVFSVMEVTTELGYNNPNPIGAFMLDDEPDEEVRQWRNGMKMPAGLMEAAAAHFDKFGSLEYFLFVVPD